MGWLAMVTAVQLESAKGGDEVAISEWAL